MSEPVENRSPRPVLEFIIKTGLLSIPVGIVVLVVLPSHIRSGRNGPGWNANVCINNLRQIDGAKQQWALENGKTNGDIVATENNLKPYLGRDPKGNFPQCPSGGKYTIGKLKEPPTCSFGTNVNSPHVLP